MDEGILSNRSQLPVTQLNYGGSADRFSWVTFHLGPLRCSGKVDGGVYPSEMTEHRLSQIEHDIESLENQSPHGSAYFTAHTNTNYYSIGVVPFKNVLVDKNTGLDHTTGRITIQISGVYHFVTTIRQDGASNNAVAISIMHNGKSVCYTYTNDDYHSEEHMLPCAATIEAAAGDTVYVYLHSGQIEDNSSTSPSCTFTGFLITTV